LESSQRQVADVSPNLRSGASTYRHGCFFEFVKTMSRKWFMCIIKGRHKSERGDDEFDSSKLALIRRNYPIVATGDSMILAVVVRAGYFIAN
jgi:hypothetical protein